MSGIGSACCGAETPFQTKSKVKATQKIRPDPNNVHSADGSKT